MADRSAAAKKGWETRRRNERIKKRLERARALSIAKQLAHERKVQTQLKNSALSKDFKKRHDRSEHIRRLEERQKKLRPPVNPVRSAAAKKGWETRRKKLEVTGTGVLLDKAEEIYSRYREPDWRPPTEPKIVHDLNEEFKPGALLALEDTMASAGGGFWDSCEYVAGFLEDFDIDAEDIRDWYDEL